ncbi:hypothetical protein [Acidithiobacillus marinus]|nr:hypothetical protein [Acidithiobacillus marinus]
MDDETLNLLVRQKVEKVQRATVRWYGQTVPQESVPEFEATGIAATNPLDMAEEKEAVTATTSARDAAIARLRGAVSVWSAKMTTEGGSEPNRHGTRPSSADSDSPSALLARQAIEATGWTHAQLCDHLHISQSLLREVLYRSADLPESSIKRMQDLIQMQNESREWDWPMLIKDGCRSTGKSEANFRKHLAGIMGVHPRTILRWSQGGFGSRRNLQLALDVRRRGWRR